MRMGALVKRGFTPCQINRWRQVEQKRMDVLAAVAKLCDMFGVNGPHWFSETNAPGPTVQLQRILIVSGVIAYAKWIL